MILLDHMSTSKSRLRPADRVHTDFRDNYQGRTGYLVFGILDNGTPDGPI